MKVLLWTGFWLFHLSGLQAQFYVAGQDPACLRWKQIQTADFQIIFPEIFTRDANHLANTLEYIYDAVSASLDHKPRKISVILHPYSATSNGFVTWAPKRMELFTTPPQDLYAQNWLDQLAVHEFRHVVQIDKLNQGLAAIAYFIVGQQGPGAFTALVPQWFFEGDAVDNETVLTHAGRGRSALFEMQMKALVTGNSRLFSYDKMLLGSYRDFVPDQYHFGYPMVAWTRNHFGPQPFNTALNYVSRRPYLVFPFSAGLKKETGLNGKHLYFSAYQSLRENEWKAKPLQHAVAAHQWNSTRRHGYTNYRFPVFINDSTLIAVKSGLGEITRFVTINQRGDEKLLFVPGYFQNDALSYAAGKLVWAEEIADTRWPNRTYSCIRLMDVANRRVRMITKKSRYFSPSLSPDGAKLVAIEVSPSNDIRLVILGPSGNIIDSADSPAGTMLQHPSWTRSGKSILVIANGKNGKSVMEYFPEQKRWGQWLHGGFSNIDYPVDAGNFIIYTNDTGGTNNIYAIQKSDTTIFKVQDVNFGAVNPDIDANMSDLAYASYASHGFDVFSMKFSPSSLERVKDIPISPDTVYKAVAAAENFNMQDSLMPHVTYPVKNYSKLTHLLNFHSWAPFYFDYNNLSVNNLVPQPGFTLLSQDKTGTMVTSLGAAYDGSHWFLKPRIIYKGLYPVFDVSFDRGGDLRINRMSPQDSTRFSGTGYSIDALAYLPLNFSRGKYVTFFYPQLEYVYRNEYFYYPSDNLYEKGMAYLHAGFLFYHYLHTSLRDLAPSFGFTLTGKISVTPFDREQFGDIGFINAKLFLPGLFPHHSLQLGTGVQWQDPRRYLYTSRLSFPRGFPVEYSYHLNTFSADYALPLAYPDFHAGPVIYIKRFKGNLFFDFANNQYKTKGLWVNHQMWSSGLDLTADFHLFRVLFPFNAGVRLFYPSPGQQYIAQMLFSIDFIYR